MKSFRALFIVVTILLLVRQIKGQESIYKIKPSDTLTIELQFIGCNGALTFKYDFYKSKGAVYGISYKSEQSSLGNPVWKVDTIILLGKDKIKLIAEYENNLLNYKPSPNTNASTGGGRFKIYSNKGYRHEQEINGLDSFNLGDNIKKMFKTKT